MQTPCHQSTSPSACWFRAWVLRVMPATPCAGAMCGVVLMSVLCSAAQGYFADSVDAADSAKTCRLRVFGLRGFVPKHRVDRLGTASLEALQAGLDLPFGDDVWFFDGHLVSQDDAFAFIGDFPDSFPRADSRWASVTPLRRVDRPASIIGLSNAFAWFTAGDVNVYGRDGTRSLDNRWTSPMYTVWRFREDPKQWYADVIDRGRGNVIFTETVHGPDDAPYKVQRWRRERESGVDGGIFEVKLGVKDDDVRHAWYVVPSEDPDRWFVRRFWYVAASHNVQIPDEPRDLFECYFSNAIRWRHGCSKRPSMTILALSGIEASSWITRRPVTCNRP